MHACMPQVTDSNTALLSHHSQHLLRVVLQLPYTHTAPDNHGLVVSHMTAIVIRHPCVGSYVQE